MDKLNDRLRIPLYMYYTAEMSVEDIALALKIPQGTVKEACALFDLPLDVNKADHEKAQKYLKELLPESLPSDSDSSIEDSFFDVW